MTDSSLVSRMVLIGAFVALMMVSSRFMSNVWGKITIKIEKGWATILNLFMSLYFFAAAIVVMIWLVRVMIILSS